MSKISARRWRCCSPTDEHVAGERASDIAGAGSRVQTNVAHAHERGHACTLCIPILSLVAWAGEERYDGALSGARDTGLITSGTHMRFHL